MVFTTHTTYSDVHTVTHNFISSLWINTLLHRTEQHINERITKPYPYGHVDVDHGRLEKLRREISLVTLRRMRLQCCNVAYVFVISTGFRFGFNIPEYLKTN